MSAIIQHYMNPLHVYCRLRNLGIPKVVAVGICRRYERYVFSYFISYI